MESGKRRACLVWHRRSGKGKTVINFIARSMYQRVGTYFHCFPEYNQGRKVLWEGRGKDGFKYIDHFPKALLAKNPNNTEMKIEYKNGSIFQIIGADTYDSAVGSNPVGIVFDEFSLSDKYQDAWNYFRPMLVENEGWAVFPFTPRGRNHGFELYQMALNNPEWFCQLLTVDDTGVVDRDTIESERRAGMSEAMILQEFYCFPEGTPILTDRGLVDIENIRINDNVLTHSGRLRPVTDTIKHLHSGDFVKIDTYGNYEPIICTPNHPLRTYIAETQEYEWVKAEDITKDHYLVMPRVKTSTPVIPRELAMLMAWFVAEGSFIKNAVQFTLSKKEIEYQTEIIEAAISLGFEPKISENETATNIIICNTRLCDFLLYECGKLAENKRIPLHLITGHEQLVFDTLIKGDGCEYFTRAKGKRYNFVTISKTLAHEFQILCSTLGYSSGISIRKARIGYIEGRQVNCSDSYQVQAQINGKPKLIRPGKHGCGVKVQSVSRIQNSKSCEVYNLKVKHDESYVACGRVVHNCSFVSSTEDIVIPFELIQASLTRDVSFPSSPRVAGLDVARFGNDRSALVVRRGGEILHIESWGQSDVVQTAGRVIDRYRTGLFDAIAVDSIGVGAGVADILKNNGIPTAMVQVSEKSTKPERFQSQRDELWWEARLWFEEGNCSISKALMENKKQELLKDIQDIHYSYTPSNKIKVESKDEMKERIKFSPDVGDALCLTFAPKLRQLARDASTGIEKSVSRYAKGFHNWKGKKKDKWDGTYQEFFA
jgi:hypothetical protein